MENQRDIGALESSKSVQVNLDRGFFEKFFPELLEDKKINISKLPIEKLDLILKAENDSLYLYDKFFKKEFRLKIPYNSTKSNLLSIIKLLLKTKTSLEKSSNAVSSQTKFQNSIAKYQKKINTCKKKVSENHSLETEGAFHQLTTSIAKMNFVQQAMAKLDNIYELPEFLLNTKEFSHNQSAQILIHENGSTSIKSISYCYEKRVVNTDCPIRTYNKIFQLIKKSKSKSFNQLNLESKWINVVGPFLAKELIMPGYSVIVILSQNGFLSPSQGEMDFFHDSVELLKPVLNKLTLKDKIISRNQNLFNALYYFPFPLRILANENQEFFKSKIEEQKGYLSSIEQEDIDLISVMTSDLENSFKVQCHYQTSNKMVSTLYHDQRISLLGDLLNTLRHELSNPLFGLQLSTEIFPGSSEETNDVLGDLKENIFRCQNIIESFSNLYKDQGLFDFYNVPAIVEKALTLSKSERVGIETELLFLSNQDRQSINIKTNQTWLIQILFNLIVNSSQALNETTGSRKVKRKISLIIFDDSHNSDLVISISDNGPGILPEKSASIFKPFFTTKKTGTGLGLSICQHLAKKLGGRLHFYNNKPLPGVTFNLRLPSK